MSVLSLGRVTPSLLNRQRDYGAALFCQLTLLVFHRDAEDLSKNAVCCTVCNVVFALSKLLDTFVVFPGHFPKIKDRFYVTAGNAHLKVLI